MLLTAFEPYGKVLSSRVMLNTHTGISRGYGFVMFESAEAATNAITALNGKPLGTQGTTISVVVARDTGYNAVAPTASLWVRNVPIIVPESVVVQHFQSLGRLLKCHMSRVHDLKHYHLDFASPSEASEAVRQLHNTKPWPEMQLPLMAKLANENYTSNIRRRPSFPSQTPPGSMPVVSGAPMMFTPGVPQEHQTLPTNYFAPTIVYLPPGVMPAAPQNFWINPYQR
jgi:polyadenylate-binding protein